MVEVLSYKFRMSRVSIDVPFNLYCDNEVVYTNSFITESTLHKKHDLKAYKKYLEEVVVGKIKFENQVT